MRKTPSLQIPKKLTAPPLLTALVGLVALALALPGSASQEGGEQIDLGRRRFVADVAMVLVDCVVTDDDGNFVYGLVQEEFQILEDDLPVDVRYFALERFRPMTTSTRDEIEDLIDARASPLERFFIVVIDGLNSGFMQLRQMKPALKEFFASLWPQDRAMIVWISPNSRLFIAEQFTSDMRRLQARVDSLQGDAGRDNLRAQREDEILEILYDQPPTNVPGGDSLGDQYDQLRQASGLARTYAQVEFDEARFIVDALLAVARRLDDPRELQGPKSVVFVSAGFPLYPGNTYFDIVNERAKRLNDLLVSIPGAQRTERYAFAETSTLNVHAIMKQTVGALNRMNFTFYTVDAGGHLELGITRPSRRYRTNLKPGTEISSARAVLDSLSQLARDTGGLPFLMTENYSEAFERIEEDTSVRYILGYYPPERPGEPEDGYREIEVKVRVPGVNVRARDGYVATR